MLTKFTVTYYVIAISMRTAGRMFNPEYRRFANALSEAQLHHRNSKALLLEYDYEVKTPYQFVNGFSFCFSM